MRRRLAMVAVLLAALSPTSSHSAVSVSTERLEGGDRYETSAAVAVHRCAGLPVLASGASYADALSATALAGYFHHGTVVLVPPDHLHPATLRALESCGPQGDGGRGRVYIVGGPAAVGDSVVADLRSHGYEVERVAGADRYETAVRVAQFTTDSGCHCSPSVAVLASGTDWPDAAAAGPLLSLRSILLTEPDQLPRTTREYLAEAINTVIIVGGTAAVSKEVEEQVRSICALGAPPRCIDVKRVAGETRQATAAAIADLVHEMNRQPPTHVVLVRGDAFPDALSAGHHALGENSAVLLTGSPSTLHQATEAWLRKHHATITSIHVIGDGTAVSEAVLEEARRAATSP